MGGRNLVSGIGQGGDGQTPGGGSVWLWDLDDVKVGAPGPNDTYPDLTAGDVLEWSASEKAWIPGSSTEVGTIFEGGVICQTAAQSGANVTGNLTIRQDDGAGSTGRWYAKDSTGTTNLTIFPSGGINAAGAIMLDKAAASQTIKCYGQAQKKLQIYVGTDGANAIQACEMHAIDSTNALTRFTSQVLIEPAEIYLEYQNDYAGLAVKGKGNTATDKIFGVFRGDGNKVFDVNGYGASSYNNFRIYRGSSVSLSAFRIDGQTTTDNSPTAALLETKVGSSDNQDSIRYKGYCNNDSDICNRKQVQDLIEAGGGGVGFNFQGTTNVTQTAPTPAAGDFYINTVAGTAANSWTGIAGSSISADQLIIWSEESSRWFAGAVEDNSTYLPIAGGTMTGKLTVQRNSQSAASNSFVLSGRISSGGSSSAQLFKTYINNTSSNSPDYIQYFGATDTNDNQIQTQGSCNSKYAQLTESNQYTSTQNITVADGQFALAIEGDSQANVDTIRMYGNGKIECDTLEVKSTNQTTTVNIPNGGLTVKAGVHQTSDNGYNDYHAASVFYGDTNFSGGSNIFERNTEASPYDFTIQGRTTSNPSVDQGNLFQVYRTTSNQYPDNIYYYGNTVSNKNIQTKESVQELIDAGQTGDSGWTSFKSLSSPWASNCVVEYRLVDGGKTCQIRIHLNQSGSYFGPTSALNIGTLPSAARPNYKCLFPVLPKSYGMEKIREVTLSQNGSVTIEPPASGTTQDLYANFMFPTAG